MFVADVRSKDTCCTRLILYAVQCSAEITTVNYIRILSCVSSIVAGALISSEQAVVLPCVNSDVFMEEMFLKFLQKFRRWPTC
jgi:hypothetical protein